MDSDDRGSNESLQESLSELASNIDGLIQLGTWQLALAREIKSKVATLTCGPREARTGKKSPAKKATRRRKR